MSPRAFAILALCGMVVLAAGIVAGPAWVSSHVVETFAAPIGASPPTPISADAVTVDAQLATRDGDGIDVAILVGVASADSHPTPPTETATEQFAAETKPGSVESDGKQVASSVEVLDECAVAETCIDQFLWSLYQRTPKLDTIRVPEQIEVKVKKKGKTRVVTKTVTKLVEEDFTWKDPKAAEKARMSLVDYVIGGIDRNFKLKLYRALHAIDDAGLLPGITSGFRDDYRQSLASGNKAAVDSSYHGGSRRGGYGHGLAVDLVSVKGETRSER